uniref:G_PROTEIN_RECEP_F1_2 domain-containing protein n=1 Tax=Heterorhabditis bacteriophora TaxID=37862 RepID=A0A1I7X7B1_HETBA
MVVTASAYTLAVIAFERSHAYAMISLVWLIALVANVLMLFMYEEQTYNLNGLTCTPIHAPVYHFANQNSIDNDNSTEEVDAVSRKPSVLEKLSAKLTLGAKNTVAKPK